MTTEKDLMDELIRELSVETLRDDDITINRLAEKAGCSKERARRILNDKVKAGKMKAVPCKWRHGSVTAYRAID